MQTKIYIYISWNHGMLLIANSGRPLNYRKMCELQVSSFKRANVVQLEPVVSPTLEQGLPGANDILLSVTMRLFNMFQRKRKEEDHLNQHMCHQMCRYDELCTCFHKLFADSVLEHSSINSK